MILRISKLIGIVVILTGINAAMSGGADGAEGKHESYSLCNAKKQIRDDLLVRVDVRDGQLKIAQEGFFRVYLLNTMDRALFNLKLVVKSEAFDAQVEPAPAWTDFPSLETAERDGREQYFTVKLKRKPGVADGEHSIELQLYSSKSKQPLDRSKTEALWDKMLKRKNPPKTFLSLDLAETIDVQALPGGAAVTVDGQAGENEWKDAALCADFHKVWNGTAILNGRTVPVPDDGKPRRGWRGLPLDQSRFRLLADKENIYCLAQFQGADAARKDVATVYLASGIDAQPLEVTIDRLTGEVTSSKGDVALKFKTDAEQKIFEIAIPRSALGAPDADSFRANFSRTSSFERYEVVSCWRGNDKSMVLPVAFCEFVFPK